MRYQYYYGILTLNSQRVAAGSAEATKLIATIKEAYDLKAE
jgi:hypothetical protein